MCLCPSMDYVLSWSSHKSSGTVQGLCHEINYGHTGLFYILSEASESSFKVSGSISFFSSFNFYDFK